MAQATTQNQFLHTNNFFVPYGSNRCIHEIKDKVFHAGYLENGNNAYLLELLGLKNMLHTSKFLMDEMSGQFYAVYGNMYQCMSTKPMLEQSWGTGEPIDRLAVTRQAFGYTRLSGPTLPLNQPQPTASTTSNLQNDILSKKPAPKTVQYQPLTFSLERLTERLTIEERIQVHHNYISTISNRKHKKDLINRLKRSNPHNIPFYETEMTHHMIMHDDVLGRILTILKQDDYYRTLEELPVINGLTTYDDIQLIPKLYDTTTIIQRVTGEADLIERQLRQPGMYPLPKTPLPSTSSFVPRPIPTFQPIAPDTSPETVNTHNPQNIETSPESSLPCGQQTPMGSTSTNSTPSQHTPPQLVVPPQPTTPQSHNLNNTPPHTQPQETPQSSPTTQPKQQSPIGTNTNPATQPSIPAAETHQPVSSSPPQHIPKSANGEGVRTVSQRVDPVHPMDNSVSAASNQDTLKKTAQSNRTAPGAGHEDMYLQGALLNSKATSQIRKDTNFGRTTRAMKLAKKSGKGRKTNHNYRTRITDVYTVPVITNPMIAPRDNKIWPTPLAILPVVQVFIKAPANFQTFHTKANPLLASPHLHSQSLTHHFIIIFNIHRQLTNN